MNEIRLLSLFCLGLVLVAPAHAAWKWTKLDYLGAIWTYPYGISGDTIVGSYTDDLGTHGFIYENAAWMSFRHPGAGGQGLYGSPGLGFVYDGQTWKTVVKEGAMSTRLLGIEGDRMVGTWHADGLSAVGFLLEATRGRTFDALGALERMCTVSPGTESSGSIAKPGTGLATASC
jgi:hypothetical protein